MIKQEFPEDESAVVGSMILDPPRIDEVVPIVGAMDFSDRRLRELFVVLVDIRDAGEPVSIQSLVSRLKAYGSYDRIGGPGALGRLANTANTADAAYFARNVRNDSIIRQVRDTLREATARTRDPNQSPDQLLDFIDSRLAELRALDTTATDRTKHIAEATLGLVDNIDAAAQTESHRGIRTGLECFDRVNGGFQNGTLNVIAARPSNGKSVLAMQFAEGISRGFEFSLSDGGNYFISSQPAIPTMFVSLEMTEEELAARSLAAATRIDGRKINSYRVTASERAKLREAANAMRSMQLTLWEPHQASVSAIRAKARIASRENGLGCLVVDYLQLVDSEQGSRHEKETYRIGEICRQLKKLAKELSIPVVVCCQLNRDAENKAPTLSQLADSGKIEQHADTVTAVHRMRGDSTEAKLGIIKWRNGQTPWIDVTFDRQHCRFNEQEVWENENYCDDFAEYSS
ncbi:replicative DNA helicase [Roseimaritima ulvae]|uniref:DNA 5'-3' helicase n=1 Tax=Roseimaritima ulvae TaxID=980254 RepID=A0A5B9QZQ0_9BACT|nr:DnaB-like helicase C-terminal domain-containing protein [Roseimaritima ulvae]QEG43459.1 Replicative DNA helicase [Roseimaritima ulvae]